MSQRENLTEYEEPELYDLENPETDPDVDFYLGIARQADGQILDLCCGTGRITIPLARQGITITGLDVMAPMLRRAREKSPGLPVEWIEADARDFHLGQRFHLIYCGAAFQHFLDRSDQEAVFACVREHLAPAGRFVFNIGFPHIRGLGDDELSEWYSYTDSQGNTVRVSGTFHYDPLTQVSTETAFRRWTGPDGIEIVREAPLKLRQFFPQEMEALLHYNGFTVLERYGDWDCSPLEDQSQIIIFVCDISRP